MKKVDGARAAGDIFREVTKSGGRPAADAERWAQLSLSVKLAELEERWEEIAGSPLAQKSQLAVCEFAGSQRLGAEHPVRGAVPPRTG